MTTFEEYPLDPLIIDALRENSYLTPTPVQNSVIPIVLEGKDCLALAETGSGKTAACAIPICHIVDPKDIHVQALIVVPTRELALQYAEETQKIGKVKGVKVFALFGGESMELQRAKLKHGVQILVATPGRLIDFIYSRAIDLSHVKVITLDEADEMLGLGFLEDLEFIMGCLVQEHQTLLFSATMPTLIHKIAKKHMKTPEEINLISDQPIPDTLSHQFFFSRSNHQKFEDVVSLLKNLAPFQSLIFVNSRNEVEKLYRHLKSIFPNVDFLHGGLDQNIRTIVTGKFSKGKIRILVATDVAARGLDFSHVTHVINLQLPQDRESYLHRAGRTARRGREGACVTLVTHRDMAPLKRLIETLGNKSSWLNEPPKVF